MVYKQVKSKDLKKYGVKINGELHLKEGVYIKFSPTIEDQLFIKTKNNKAND